MRYCLSLISFLFFTPAAFAQTFLPDPQFGIAGVVVTAESGKTSVIHKTKVQPDGKIVAAGMIYDNNNLLGHHVYLVRYKTNGTPDSTFGINGKVLTTVGERDIAYDLAIQPDGKIVVVGSETVLLETDPSNVTIINKPFLLRYTATGTLDNSFADNGIHHLDLLDVYPEKYLSSVALRSDGSILAGGGAVGWGFYQLLMVCLNPDGTYNNNFGTAGQTLDYFETGKASVLFDMALLPNDKVVVTGTSGQASLTDFPNTKVGVAKFNSDGSLDATFGTGGRVATAISASNDPYDAGHSLAVQGDGKIVVAGASDKRLAMLRYLPDGSPDVSFGTSGIVVNPDQVPATALRITSQGKFITGGLVSYNNPFATDIVLGRYNTNGAIDNSFGNNGQYIINRSDRDQMYCMTIQSDNKIIISGDTRDSATGNTSFTLFRFMDNEPSTGIKDKDQRWQHVKIYPNPATGQLNIYAPLGRDAAIRIVNITGQVIYTGELKTELTRINTTQFAPGMYLLQITAAAGNETYKFEVN